MQKTIGRTKLPENILIYYSGHNTKVSELVKSYEKSFKPKVQKADSDASRRFLGIGADYKQIFISTLLLQTEDNNARLFICEKLGIKHTIKAFSIT